jgi:hypothetical protein
MGMCQRVPVKVKRKPVTAASKNGRFLGGWYAFPKPNEAEPYLGKLRRSQRVLWCPYCDGWTVFDKNNPEYDGWKCTGVCGWANTNEYYVKYYNKLWYEDVPLGALKNLSIPAPAKGRR